MSKQAEVPRLSEPPAADVAVANAIRIKLAEPGLLRAAHLEVDSVGGVITLRGIVGSPAERALAGAISRTIQGVRAVNNLLRVP